MNYLLGVGARVTRAPTLLTSNVRLKINFRIIRLRKYYHPQKCYTDIEKSKQLFYK